ncbi:hypothetical protein CW749_05520 [Vibrio sp. vnigr-6D03]|uniref:hypothetical protein n=1 Tax=Vibrio sp. vnigr-6D03 TaxID=2058088 RepID=UPI000C34622B|nr:hypothetical protein [Vibrio sp. vnigr-6D03]PKF80631.1 hypothetical protein CW749_05520 [Vibrio sp. vnigr-6D03]
MDIDEVRNKYLKLVKGTTSTLDYLSEELYSEFSTQISECKCELDRIESELSAVDNSNISVDCYNDLIARQMENQIELEYVESKVYVIRELEVIYKYRNIEIALKHFISLAYPDADTHGLYNWDALKELTKSKGASISQAKHYQLINDLRRVSNALKHSNQITNDVKKANIKEFKGLNAFCGNSLGEFYKRVEPSVSEFYISFCGLLLSSLGDSESEWLELFKPYVSDDPEIPF